MRFGVVVVLFSALAGCVSSNAVLCDDGRTCPSETACDLAHHTCVAPEQLVECASAEDNTPCSIGSTPGICDMQVCIAAGCGDGHRNDPELCDGEELGSGNCTDFGFYDSKPPKCNSACSYDTSNCTGFCGDGVVTAGFEICEPTIAPTESCVDFGFGAGVLECQACGAGFDACKSFDWRVLPLDARPEEVHGIADNDVYAAIREAGLAHFDGSAWSTLDLPCLMPFDELYRVWQVAPGVVFAGGNGGLVIRVVNGTCTRWDTIGGASVQDIYASSADDAWVVASGLTTTWHFNGTDWAVSPGSSSGEFIWGTSPTNIYVATITDKLTHFNGTTWSTAASVPGVSEIWSLWGSSTDVYVGGQGVAAGYPYPAVVTRSPDGTNWTQILGAEPVLSSTTYSFVRGGWTVGSRTVVSVSVVGPDTRGVVLEHDGLGWTNIGAPVLGGGPLWLSDRGRVVIPDAFNNGVIQLDSNVRVDHDVFLTSANRIAVGAGDTAFAASGSKSWAWDGKQWTERGAATDVDISPTGIGYGISDGGLNVLTGPDTTAEDTAIRGNRLTVLADDDIWVWSDNITAEHVYQWQADAGITEHVYDSNLYRMYDLWGIKTTTDVVFLAGYRDVSVSEAKVAVLRWSGSAWTPMTLPDINGALTTIWGRSATDVYAAGYDNTSPSASVALLLHYDGTTWTKLPAPPSEITIFDIWGPTANDLFATTVHGVSHFDGTRWSPVDPGAPYTVQGLGGAGDNVLWLDYRGRPHQLVRLGAW